MGTRKHVSARLSCPGANFAFGRVSDGQGHPTRDSPHNPVSQIMTTRLGSSDHYCPVSLQLI